MASPSERLILASASVVRARLLRAAGVDPVIEPAQIDEPAIKRALRDRGGNAGECALALAESKAAFVSARHPSAVVIGADQILVCRAEWFDKPADLPAVRHQLQVLRSNCHLLETAACAVKAGGWLWTAAAAPRLIMREFKEVSRRLSLSRGRCDLGFCQRLSLRRPRGPVVRANRGRLFRNSRLAEDPCDRFFGGTRSTRSLRPVPIFRWLPVSVC